jgi:hypothetical protein
VIHSTFGGKELRQRPLQPIRLPQIAMGGPKERQSITGRGLGPQVNGMTNHKFNESTTSPRFSKGHLADWLNVPRDLSFSFKY